MISDFIRFWSIGWRPRLIWTNNKKQVMYTAGADLTEIKTIYLDLDKPGQINSYKKEP